jgi:hypothetical protein
MSMRFSFSFLVRLALVATCALTMAACDTMGDLLFGENYEGPQPASEGISDEVAIVRSVEVVPSGGTVLLVDRVRYTNAGDPHNVNRVVRLLSGETMREPVAALNLSRGDSVRVSTEYEGPATVVGSMSVPNWPGHDADVYPIAVHLVTAIARAGN